LVVKKVRVPRSELPSLIKVSIASATYDDIENTITYTFSKPHRVGVGYTVNISSAIPAEFNQTNAKVIDVVNTTSFTIAKTVTSSYISGGYIEVPVNPSIDTYLVKYRIVNNQNEFSQWSPLFAVKNTYEEDTFFSYLDGGEE
jgi:hypothetical protein